MNASTKIKNSNEKEFQEIIDLRRKARMGDIDSLSPALRECVHEYGWTVVKSFLEIGVTKPKHIRHLVERVLDEFSPTRGSSSAQGIRADSVTRALGPFVKK